MCTITDLKICAASAGGCSSSISGIQKVWIFDCDSIDVEDIVVTEGTGTCRRSSFWSCCYTGREKGVCD